MDTHPEQQSSDIPELPPQATDAAESEQMKGGTFLSPAQLASQSTLTPSQQAASTTTTTSGGLTGGFVPKP
ncbi:MAG TPA: hypothetical protein VKA84_12155 [Gemmatimonadaceae bacterium]|nr:hypothetical protein [Gemmatimonadaceae bacterium]